MFWPRERRSSERTFPTRSHNWEHAEKVGNRSRRKHRFRKTGIASSIGRNRSLAVAARNGCGPKWHPAVRRKYRVLPNRSIFNGSIPPASAFRRHTLMEVRAVLTRSFAGRASPTTTYLYTRKQRSVNDTRSNSALRPSTFSIASSLGRPTPLSARLRLPLSDRSPRN